MDFSIDMLSAGNADSHIIWIKEAAYDLIVFIDGGYTQDGKNAIQLYQNYIQPYVPSNVERVIINTHLHQDHLEGLSEILTHFGKGITAIYFNNPRKYFEQSKFVLLEEVNRAFGNTSKAIKQIYESLHDVDNFSTLSRRLGVPCFPAFSSSSLGHNYFSFLGPSEEFYVSKLAYFSDAASLIKIATANIPESIVNEVVEGRNPCEVVDEVNDDSAENITSILTQFVDSSNRRWLFTSDAGVDSFEDSRARGFNLSNFHFVQLPHHGSRRNMNTNWVVRFNPTMSGFLPMAVRRIQERL